ncbi:MAG: hypothetical protein JKX79_12210 [Labilibaculum sp.]|nr:hypothetical protein [Labilibaculum sp.]
MQIRTTLILALVLFVAGLRAQEVASLNSDDVTVWPLSNKQENDFLVTAPDEQFTFTFYSPDEEKLSLPVRASVESTWGTEIAQYYALFESVYMYEEQPVEGDPNVVLRIRKPRIYKSIKRIESYLKKELKNENCSLTSASQQIKQILKIGIAAISEDSEWLEKQLKKKKSKKEEIAFYNKIVLINI